MTGRWTTCVSLSRFSQKWIKTWENLYWNRKSNRIELNGVWIKIILSWKFCASTQPYQHCQPESIVGFQLILLNRFPWHEIGVTKVWHTLDPHLFILKSLWRNAPSQLHMGIAGLSGKFIKTFLNHGKRLIFINMAQSANCMTIYFQNSSVLFFLGVFQVF